MSERTVSRLSWLLAVATAALLCAGLFLMAIGPTLSLLEDNGFLLLIALPFLIVGTLITYKRQANPVGWLFLGFAFVASVAFTGLLYFRAGSGGAGSLPGADLAASLAVHFWHPGFALFILAFLLFPEGRFLSRFWRWVAWLTGILGIVGVLSGMLEHAFYEEFLEGAQPEPLLRGTVADVAGAIFSFCVLALVAMLVTSSVGIFIRFRRSSGTLRQQMKWVVSAVVLFAIALPMSLFVLGAAYGIYTLPLIPISMGIAILTYRLYDIDVVINKTLVFGALAAFITGIYVAVVVGLGELLGSSDEPNLALSIAATAIVAIAFQPVRDRVERVANRLVYGIRRTPYEILAEFSERVATSYETQEVTPAMAHTLREATGAALAEVWLALDSTLVLSASTEAERTGDDVIALEDSGIDAIDADEVVPVTHHDELLGALAITKDRAEPVTAADRRLLSDLAAQAGIVLRNARLTAELQARLDEISMVTEQIRESRRRIVATQDQARRRLERDIHDGAQQHLVALAVKLNLAKTMVERKPERAGAMLDQLDTEMGDALETLSDLARGIYPPLLKERGIAAALEARGASAPFELMVVDRTTSRADEATEAAVYFCCLEALQNVVKYAEAARVTVELDDVDGGLSFRVSDDGRGFDTEAVKGGSGLQGMSDRLAAVGGVVEIRSQPGRGTTVSGRLRMSSRAVLESSP